MIKKYRNALLAAAVATIAAGCGGGSNADDPIESPTLVDDITNGDVDPLRRVADLIGGLMAQVTGGAGDIFDTFNVLSSEESSIGKVLGAGLEGNAVSTPTGVKSTDISAACSGSEGNVDPGTFTMDILLAPVINGEVAQGIPDVDDLFGEMTRDDLKISLNLVFDNCDEPKHVYDGDVNTSPTEGQSMRILDGSISVILDSDKDLADAGNTDDFKLQGTVEMNNYFVQTDAAIKPDLASGNVAITLVTSSASTGPFQADLDFDLITNDGESGGYIDTSVNVKGTIDVDSSFTIGGYDLEVGGSLLSTRPASVGSYSIATTTNIQLSGSDGEDITPTAGAFAVGDGAYTHFAEIKTVDGVAGIEFNVQKDANNTRQVTFCSWDQVNEVDGQSCAL